MRRRDTADRPSGSHRLLIGNDVFIGHNAVILPTTREIGDGAFIGAGAVVQNPVPPYAVVMGNPARVVKYRFSRETIADLLESQGHTVLSASGPAEGLALSSSYEGRIDLLLTDVVMPEMSGPALAQRLVAVQPQLRVLFMSGYSEVSPLDPAHPNTSFLSKPFQASVLAEKVKQVLSRAREAS